MAQPVVETDIVAVAADGANTKQNIAMCEARRHIVCNVCIVASPVVRPAHQKSPHMPDILYAQAKAVDVMGKLDITRDELHTSKFRYYLVMSSGSRESLRNYNCSILRQS